MIFSQLRSDDIFGNRKLTVFSDNMNLSNFRPKAFVIGKKNLEKEKYVHCAQRPKDLCS